MPSIQFDSKDRSLSRFPRWGTRRTLSSRSTDFTRREFLRQMCNHYEVRGKSIGQKRDKGALQKETTLKLRKECTPNRFSNLISLTSTVQRQNFPQGLFSNRVKIHHISNRGEKGFNKALSIGRLNFSQQIAL